jgi:H+-transporting ATPase
MQSHSYYKKGLSTSEVAELQKQYGRNEIEEKFQSGTVRFLKKFVKPIPLMIETALLLSVLAGRWEDFFIVLILLVVNIAVDFVQEQKARKALQALKNTLPLTAMVLRDGVFSTIDARELVPRDIIKLAIGDVVPADAVLIDDSYLYVNQSIITGESFPVEKRESDPLYAGSIIQKGSALGQVTATGLNSSTGKNAQLVAQAEREKESHFQKAIFGIGRFLIALSITLIAIVFTILTLRGDPLIESTRFILVLAIASIPVALPTVLSVTMAIGATVLAKKKAIVSNFKSIEELAGIDELCVDKTGTLTKNKIAVFSPKAYSGFGISDLFTYGLLATDTERRTPIEKAIYEYAKKHNLAKNITSYEIDSFIPFDPTRKMTEALVHTEGTTDAYTIIMGAPQVIIKRIGNSQESEMIAHDVQEFGKDGLRVIVVARKGKNKFHPVGIIPLLDFPRDDSKSVISSIKKGGIQIKMLTGDNTAIASFIARKLQIGTNIVNRSLLQHARKTKNGNTTIEKADIFTEVVPEDKYYIVDTLQKRKHIVAMTGDGVNDAPALKKADIGIAVSGASAAAQSAADIVLLDSGLSIIKDAIDHARMIFARMQSYATFRIAETIRIIFFVTISILVFNYSPLSAAMIILLALLNDIPVISIAYDNAQVSKKPIRWHIRETLFISTILGITGLISSFALFYWLNASGYAITIIQTILFLKLDVSGHSTLYLTRTGRKHFWERPFPSLKFFIPAFSSRIIGTLLVFYGIFMEPIGWKTIGYIWIYSTAWFLFNDQIKVLSYKLLDRFKENKI